MVDLDSNPTKLIEIVEIGKQLLITRGALTTFSIANDVAKYFAIIPAMFVVAFPQLRTLNVMHLHSPHSAILSAVIFNASSSSLLIPLALRGVKYRPIGAAALLRYNLLVYGLGGVIAPFVGIKLIDLHPRGPPPDDLGGADDVKYIWTAIRMTIVTAVLLGHHLSAGHDRHRPGHLPGQGRRQPGQAERRGDRLEPHRPELHGGRSTSSRARRRRATATTPWTPSSRTWVRPARPWSTASRPRSSSRHRRRPRAQVRPGAGRHGHDLGAAGSTPTSRSPTRARRRRAWPPRAA